MDTHLFCGAEDPGHKFRLLHGFPAGECDPAACKLEKVFIPLDLFYHRIQVDRLPVPHFPSIRILAVLAAQRAAGEEDRHAGARTVDGGHELPRMDRAGVAGPYRLQTRATGQVLGGDPIEARPVEPPGRGPERAVPGRRHRVSSHLLRGRQADWWKVRLSTSSCCSLVSLTKFTA